MERAWQAAVALVQDVAMDESGLKYKGFRDGRMMRNIAKPARYFLKVFGLAAGATIASLRGYIYAMDVYGGAGDVGDVGDAAADDAADDTGDAAATADATAGTGDGADAEAAAEAANTKDVAAKATHPHSLSSNDHASLPGITHYHA